MIRLPLSQGKFALVDEADFERVRIHRWYASLESRGTKWYAKRWAKKHEKGRWKAQCIRLHHFILDIPPHELPPDHVVDHKNDDGLDNTRDNLNIITQEHNMKKVPRWCKKPEDPCL